MEKQTRVGRVMVAAATAALLCSCLPEFDNPPSPGTPATDPKLMGNWAGSELDREGQVQLSVFPRASGWADLVYVSNINSPTDRAAEVAVLDGYTTAIKGQHYLCFRERMKDGTDPNTNRWNLAHYEIARNRTLTIHPFTDESVGKLVSAGDLKGTVKSEGLFSQDVHVTATARELTEAIARHGWRAFTSDDTNAVMKFTRARR